MWWAAGRALVWPWLRRYLPAELLAIAAAMVCATCATIVTNDELLIVAASIAGSTAGYYGLIVIFEIVQTQAAYRARHARYTQRAAFATIRGLMLEFGGAELLDSLLFSPVLLYVCIQVAPNLQLAVVLSELASSTAFYITVAVLPSRILRPHPGTIPP